MFSIKQSLDNEITDLSIEELKEKQRKLQEDLNSLELEIKTQQKAFNIGELAARVAACNLLSRLWSEYKLIKDNLDLINIQIFLQTEPESSNLSP